MIISRFPKLVLLTALLLALVAFNGCSDDDDNDDGIVDPPTPVQPPTTDVLMDHFQISYTEMDLSVFEDILHDDFKMMFTEETINDWDLESGAFLNNAQMLAIHDNMFSGNPGSAVVAI